VDAGSREENAKKQQLRVISRFNQNGNCSSGDRTMTSLKTSHLKVRKIGNSLGVVLPKEVLEALKVGEGDDLFVNKSEQGITLRSSDPDFEYKMQVAREVMHKYRNVLRELAK
jgi:putative addiction module antidote